MSRAARRRLASALVVPALLLASCGQDEGIVGGGSVIGDTLTVFSLLPDPGSGTARDVVDGERLALEQAGGRVGPFSVNFSSLDETAGAGADEQPGRVASVARQAISDPQIIAAIGDLDDRTARVTVPLLNSAGILHVSPGVVDPGFTVGGSEGEPGRWYPAGKRTFFPLSPDAARQGRALAGALRGRVLVEQEESPAGRALGGALRAALGPGRLATTARTADAAVYAGTDPQSARGVVEGLRREAPGLEIHLPAAPGLLPLAGRPRITVLSAFPAPDAAFRRAFSTAFGRDPGPGAVAGHAAMRQVLAAIAAARPTAASRPAVIGASAVPPARLYELTGRPLRSRVLGGG
jgi:hypothetical protein